MGSVSRGFTTPDPSNYSDWKDWARDLRSVFEQQISAIVGVVEGLLDFGDGVDGTGGNLRTLTKIGTTPTPAGTEFSVAHDFGVIPIGALLVSKSAAGHVYKGVTAWTTSTASFKSDVTGMAYTLILLFPPQGE